MLNRPKHFPIAFSRREGVRLARGKTPEEAHNEWCSNIYASAPRFCEQHPQTALIAEDNFWPETELGARCETVVKPRQFEFYAGLVCPACRIAYALCPPEFHETSFDTFDTSISDREAMLAKAREFAAQVSAHGRGFAVFVGPPGIGKTRLACNILREVEFRDALYVRQGALTSAVRATYGRKDVFLHSKRRDDDDDEDSDDTPTPLEIVQKVRFLVLDEIGCTDLANDERLLIDELLKYRYEHRKPTILISNLPLTGTAERPGLKQFLGDALADRIQEATGNGKYIVQFSGPSYRRSTGESYLQRLG
jgi:DNA replication protein DnaC